MWRWALRSFFDERASLAASAGGVGVLFLLVLILEGTFRGEADQVVAFVERSSAPVWVLQDGVTNMHMAASVVGEDVAARVRVLPEVAHVEGIVYGGAFARIGRQEPAVYLVGLRPGQRTGPWDMAAGRAQPERQEVVLPEVLARRGGVALGEDIIIDRRTFRVVGLSRGTYSMANPLLFLHASDLLAMFDMVADANYLLVWPAMEVESARLADRIREVVPEVSVLEKQTLVANDRTLALQMGGELIRIMTVVAALVATLIVAFTASTFVARRSRELAVARAVGARRGQLLGAVMAQAAALALLGYGIAVALAAVLSPLFAAFAPAVVIHVSAASSLRLGAAALVVAALSGAWPAWRVVRVDPTLVFSS